MAAWFPVFQELGLAAELCVKYRGRCKGTEIPELLNNHSSQQTQAFPQIKAEL